MILTLCALIVALLCGLAILARRGRNSRRRLQVWICTDCWVGFSTEAAALQHVHALHR